jgi:hypothetical protein
LVDFIGRINEAIRRISLLHLTTISRNYFPYSTILNYDINKRFRQAYLNRPTNDSFMNYPGISLMCEGTEESARQRNSSGVPPTPTYPADYPFNACYGAWLLGEDTYSTQKALYLTTKNTSKYLRGVASDPPVAKFLGPKEPVGAEVSPKADALPVTPVTATPKVGGRGYWRLGVVQTMCSGGQNDYDNYKQQYYIDYPVLGAYGDEGAKWATPAYSPIPAPIPKY